MEIPEAALRIAGLMTRGELALLCRMARSARSVVELGCYKGRSLAAMGLINPAAKLYGVDWFGDMSHRGYKGSTEGETRANLEKLGVGAQLFVGRTNEVAPAFAHKVDLLHVDAGHSYEECTADLRDWTPKVNPGGGLCVHDYGAAKKKKLDRPEVKRAVDDWTAGRDDWTLVEHVDTMVAFRHLIADQGVLFVAYGEKARTQCQNAMAHVRHQARKLPIAVVSDTKLDGADHMILHVEADRGARTQKTRMYALSPFRKTLFLDADTEMRSSPAGGFKLLEYVDVVLAQDVNRRFSLNKWPNLRQDEVAATKAELGTDELIYYNSGVFFFRRNERTRRLMQRWHEEWQRWGMHDQMALLRAIHASPARIAPMREAWNTHKTAVAQFVYHKHRTASREGAPR